MRIEHFEFVVILTIIRPNKIEKKKGLDTHHDNKQGGESKKNKVMASQKKAAQTQSGQSNQKKTVENTFASSKGI